MEHGRTGQEGIVYSFAEVCTTGRAINKRQSKDVKKLGRKAGIDMKLSGSMSMYTTPNIGSFLSYLVKLPSACLLVPHIRIFHLLRPAEHQLETWKMYLNRAY